MKTDPAFERCLAYINCEIHSPDHPISGGAHFRAITISRQTGSGAHKVAERLAQLLQQSSPAGTCPWTVFDRNLVERVLNDHNMPSHLARFMPEDRILEISDTMDELFGLHPPSWSLVRDVSDTILRLLEKGNVIIIGRAGAVIAARMDHVFHVRLVGSAEQRSKRLQEQHNVSEREASEQLTREDRGRERYVRKYFGKDVNDPLLYHMTLNTDYFSEDEVARLISDATMTSRPSVMQLAV